ncbi:MAG TPA: hypothetical protein PLR73_05810 [Acetivibrio sp.]|nr:hypothetical protein [Acetivibrio sp.]
MPKRLKYPEAREKYLYYENIVYLLRSKHSDIEDSVNKARSVSSSLIHPQDVYGEYYNIYISKVGDWVGIHSRQIAVFDSFLIDLETCINNAKDLRDLWSSRIGIWEEY